MEFHEEDTVLVGCPMYAGMASVLDEYLEAYSALQWPKRKLMLVDNTDDGGEYAASIRPKVEAVGGEVKRVVPSDDWEDTFHRCWSVLQVHAQWNGYTWFLSLEQDVIVPPLTLDAMLNVAGYCKAPFVLHTYPYHNGKPGFYQGLGCTLIKTELLTVALESVYTRIPFVEAAIFDAAKRGSHVVLHRLLDVQHRDPTGTIWRFSGASQDEVTVGIESAWPHMAPKAS